MRDEQGTIVVRGNLRQGHLIVTRATANRVPPMALLATGSGITMGNAALRHALWARRRLGPVELVLDVGDRRNIGRGPLPDEEGHDR